MWEQLAALLQVLNEQPETVLSDVSRRSLEACVRTGTCNNVSLSKVCCSLRCCTCGEVIDDKWFHWSGALKRNAFIECEVCDEKDMKEFCEACSKFSDRDNRLLSRALGNPKREWKRWEREKLDRMAQRCYGARDFDELVEDEGERCKGMTEDEKIVYPNGRYRKAHWEELLKVRGVPLIPPQLGNV